MGVLHSTASKVISDAPGGEANREARYHVAGAHAAKNRNSIQRSAGIFMPNSFSPKAST